MRTLQAVSLAVLVCLATASVMAEDISLPAPRKTGGTPLFQAIDTRGSAGQKDFPKGQLDANDLSTILWAATGTNRDGAKWTVPMGMGRPPYCKVYVATDDGVFLYDWKNNALKSVNSRNVKALLPEQQFAKDAPAQIYIATDGKALAGMPNKAWAAEWGALLAGAMSQNIYLACEGIGVGTRLLYSMDRDLVREHCKLAPEDTPLFVMVLGKR